MDFRSRIALCALLATLSWSSTIAQEPSDAKQAVTTGDVPAVVAAKSDTTSISKKSVSDVVRSIAMSQEPFRGSRDAKVTILFFDDYQCPYCGYMYKVLFDDVMKEYGDRAKVYLKDVPNPMIHPWAKRAAINARCLAQQDTGAYWEFTDQVHLNQSEVGNEAKLDEIAIGSAKKRDVDLAKLKTCLQQQPNAAVVEGYRVAYDLEITAVPVMFVNEEKVVGAVDAKVLRDAIGSALLKAEETTAKTQQSSRVSTQDF